MLILSRFIDIEEFSSASVMAKNGSKVVSIKATPKGLRINLVRLATAIAKTMYCRSLEFVELPFIVTEQIFALQRLTASSIPPRHRSLRLSERHVGRLALRDFSKTTSEGQYAQGLCFLFAQDHLGLPALIDFDRYCIDIGVPILVGGMSRPDFVACENHAGYCLIEAKGNLESSSVKSELRTGLNQCAAGRNHLLAQGHCGPLRSYCALTSFRLEGSANDSRICFADPEDATDGREDFNALSFLRKYYERALRALGYRGSLSNIWQDRDASLFRNRISVDGVDYFEIASDDNGGELFRELHSISHPRGPEFYSAGVAVDIIEALQTGELNAYFEHVRRFKERVNQADRVALERSTSDLMDWNEHELFVDGTIVSTVW